MDTTTPTRSFSANIDSDDDCGGAARAAAARAPAARELPAARGEPPPALAGEGVLDWKARAVRHMVALALKRSKAQREIKHAAQLQKQLHAVEKTLQECVALEETAHLPEQKEQMLTQRIDKASTRHRQARERETGAIAQTDTTAAIDSSSAREPTGTASTGGGSVGGSASPDHTNEPFDSTTLTITGLTAVSEKCLHWFHEHVEQTFTQQQQKAELEQLRSRVESVTQLQHVNVQLENELSKFQTRCVEHSHTQNQLGDQMRLLVTEIRQYLRLVRVEIKKKFGYVPKPSRTPRTGPVSWTLERHVRLANVTITSPSRAR